MGGVLHVKSEAVTGSSASQGQERENAKNLPLDLHLILRLYFYLPPTSTSLQHTCRFAIGHFRVALNLIMKARLCAFLAKISFHAYANKTNFHMKSLQLTSLS